MNKTITFDNLKIEYDFSLSFDETNASISINIVFPHSFTLKNQLRLKALEKAILLDNDEIIQVMSNFVAKEGHSKKEVKCTFQQAISFDSLTLGGNQDSFFFNKESAAQMNVEPENSAAKKHILSGLSLNIEGKTIRF